MNTVEQVLADPHIQSILMMDFDIMKRGGQARFKWTCRGCGERVVSDNQDGLHTSYIHDDCGVETDTLDGDIGIMAIFPAK